MREINKHGCYISCAYMQKVHRDEIHLLPLSVNETKYFASSLLKKEKAFFFMKNNKMQNVG